MRTRREIRGHGRRWHLLAGLAAFLWVVIRSGEHPKRLTYPCQQAAMPIAAAWLLSLTAFVGCSLALRKYVKLSGVAALVVGVAWFTATSPDFTRAHTTTITSLPVWEVPNPVSTVFVMDSIPPTIGTLAAGDSSVPNEYLRDPAVDTLMLMMASKGISLHNTAAHPTGLVHGNDIVVIKGNYQWTSRNTTSADRVKGIIRQILMHPEGFTGEIIVCDNTQEIGTGINDNDNNSEDPNQSVVDVVNTFRAKGFPVYVLDWRDYWGTVVSEYSAGDYVSGYVYEPSTKVSYPKFRSPSGRFAVSLRYGIWDSLAASYDHSRLCIIDMAVLKAHSIAGATIAVKNWIGTLTTAYATERYGGRTAMHNTYLMGAYGLVARVMAVTFPRLVLIDAAWTTTNGPVSLTEVQNTRMLLGSTDPVASSWYAAKFILTPIARYPNNTNPDRPGSSYKNALDNWTRILRDSAGLACTKDSSRISVYDRRVLQGVSVGTDDMNATDFHLYQNYPNPFNPSTEIGFRIADYGLVTLKVYDMLGREVATLVNEVKEPGTYTVQWSAKGGSASGGDASAVSSGVYFYRLTAGNFVQTRKMAVVR